MEENKNINQTETEPRGPWKAFAIAGFASGIVSLGLFFIPIWAIAMGIPGLVLSILGKKSVVQRSKANIGMGLCIAGIAVGFVCTIIFYTIIIGLAFQQTH